MSSYLPCSGFDGSTNVDNFDLNSINENDPIRQILKVDLIYPEELHELHSDYLFAQEKLGIPYDMLPYYCK